ncbi:MAG TPA: hypothetical protein VFK16_09560 [Gemmatimonadaceae bacterium]|jgi:hypothetical protein|nr:hypothetical protein [Gemmatimonadaceae bacterium]
MTRADAQLALRLVAHDATGSDERQLEARLADEGLDAVLDDPRLPAALLHEPLGAVASLPLLVYVMLRSVLRRLGEDDPVMSDYLAAVVLAFGAHGRALRCSETDDEVYDTLAALVRDVEVRDARRSLLVRAHLGNYALWLSGLFADRIEYQRWRRGGPALDYYETLGRRGFALAAAHPSACEQGMAELFQAVSDRFATLRLALTSFSDALLFPGVQSPERLMRQVRDEMRWRWAS